VYSAIDVWCDLEDALRGESKYAGDTCQIYAFRLVGHRPAASAESEMGAEMLQEYGEMAWRALLEVCVLFQQRRNCVCYIENRSIAEIYQTGYHEVLTHRAHVRVERAS
jgi:hypothetical protein